MMSRLTGGIGGRGPGETKLEIDRRRARERIHRLEQQIEQLRQAARRSGARGAAQRELPVVAIVGYTNAGKSTLLNALTEQRRARRGQALRHARSDQPRRLRFPRGARGHHHRHRRASSATCPRIWCAAFRATLEELDDADLLLHVVDAADPAREAADPRGRAHPRRARLGEKPRLLVFNKCDKLAPEQVIELAAEREQSIAISAKEVRTTKPLLVAMERLLWQDDKLVDRPQLDEVLRTSSSDQ